jgi:hypothetical protein
MSTDLILSCRCGAVRGFLRGVTPARVTYAVCYCDDCQTFAHALERGDVLDERGGSHIVQGSPALLEITDGLDKIVCLQLRPKGLVRWYTSCCRTPVVNTLYSPRPPFNGTSRAFITGSADGRPMEEATGPVRGRVQPRWAKGDPATLQADRYPVRLIARSVRKMLGWWLKGDAKRSPLRDAQGVPRVAPRVLTEQELHEARARAGV